ncbi:D-alanyl-D-alanine carboxypeptidase family protein [Sandaracinobacteroides saxicola]|uniref:D-alanyl-D-alanine carboxypeptidase n=1 Tax=Sandaracinobacteroides saxicola TaxID=2759707 RepID=A0A7G5IG06_9SPHN|nr:D-alanyl-D-alanine carboxypeptidase family protein [Sandaracinobacteroides saxicola]QMW22298.1 D-alanyl-D-alanine carboxypeptidase [Sandaracinobacteroides saxicola]
MPIQDSRVRRSLLSLAALAAASLAAPAAAASLVGQPKYAAALIDAKSGELLYSRMADEPRYPASITKVMTLYLAFEQLAAGRLRLDDRLTVSRFAANQRPSRLGLRPGTTISVDEAIRAIACKSANDMAVALAERLAGSESAFAELMTLRARQLGMANTSFYNASGLPDARQLTTARDIATLSRAMIRSFPQYYGYFQQPSFTYGPTIMQNHNHLLRTMPGVDGIKTGFTNAAGFTLAASAVRDGRRLVAVVLGAPARRARDSNVESLLNAGFDVLSARTRGARVAVADLLAEPGDLNDELLTGLVEQGSADPQPRALSRVTYRPR